MVDESPYEIADCIEKLLYLKIKSKIYEQERIVSEAYFSDNLM